MKNASNWLKNALFQLRDLDLKERAIQVKILDLLLEVERRKAYAEMGYEGLFSFCVKELGYSEAQSYQRIQAMHAMRSVPEIKTKIETGALNLTSVAQVQVMIRQEQMNDGIKRTAEEKRELFSSFEGKSTREVKEEIAERRGERLRMKLSLELDEEGEELWSAVRAKSAHQTRGSDLLCLKMLMKEWLAKKQREDDPRRGISGSLKQMRREVLTRDDHQCRNCGSKYAIQIDHVQPRALNGSNERENLRALCRSCNLSFAIREFGLRSTQRMD